MSRMERRRLIEEKRKIRKIKWMLVLAFAASTVFFYFLGPYFFGTLPWQQEQVETYNVIFDDKGHDVSFFIEENIVFLPLDWVEENIIGEVKTLNNPLRVRMIIDKSQLLYEDLELTEFMTESEIFADISLVEVENQHYFPLSGLDPLLKQETQYHPETDMVTIDIVNKPYQTGIVAEETELKENTGFFSRGVGVVNDGEKVRVLEIGEDYTFIRKTNGLMGYLSNSSLESIQRQEPERDKLTLGHVTPEVLDHPFGMVWEYVGNSHPDRSNDEKIPALSVVSPTWFDLENEHGDLTGKAQFRYASYMRDRGYQIWGLVTNSFDPDMTESFLMNREAQDHFTRQLLLYASLYQMEGINIDFENIHYRNQDAFTDFVRRFSEKMKDQDLIISIDVTIPGGSLNWSQVYDRTSLAPLVDYVCVMTYDEHWGSSPVAGSVASLGWVENGIQNTLREVPAEKTVLGLPFYTRLWEETTQPDGNVSVSSRALGMEYAQSILQENGIEKEDWEWQEEAGQYYAEYEAEGNRYRVWLEEERSIERKSALVAEYGLAGFAGWRKGFEKPSIWDVLENAL
ncbi:MAG: hypothetical protein D5S00_00690 [Tindallia sp. MSAO_Bac2]|nr:MAG: hypothetical protein D5S00_00690 [Tindallia sp. MSAO_Bac2]